MRRIKTRKPLMNADEDQKERLSVQKNLRFSAFISGYIYSRDSRAK